VFGSTEPGYRERFQRTGLSNPPGVAVDTIGTVYFTAEYYNQVVKLPAG
jgi:hypothetical protein